MRRLAIPFEWQGAVIRAAITLQLNAYAEHVDLRTGELRGNFPQT